MPPLSPEAENWLKQYFVDTYSNDWASAYQIELVGEVPVEVLGWADTEQLPFSDD